MDDFLTIPEHVQVTTRSEHVQLEIERHLALGWINLNTYARATRWRTLANMNKRVKRLAPVLRIGK